MTQGREASHSLPCSHFARGPLLTGVTQLVVSKVAAAAQMSLLHTAKIFAKASFSNLQDPLNQGNIMSFTPAPTSGDDVITGDDLPDIIDALLGNDTVYGQGGNDQLVGGIGNDTLYGGTGNDLLDGGNDLLPPGKEADLFGSNYFGGSDALYGGAGDDTYQFGRSSRSDRIFETAVSGESNQLRFEAGIIAADVAVRREGNDLNFYVVGFIENKLSVVDYFTATNRPLTQAVFSDGTVWGASVFESAQVGPVGNADRFIRGTDGNETLTGTGGNDTIDGMDGTDNISGGDGNDYLLGGAGQDLLRGGNGDDLLNGGSSGTGPDILLGGAGADTLLGDEGADFLDGGTGNDVLDGGTGQNRLIFQHGDGQDVIRSVASNGLENRNDVEMVYSYAVGSLGASPVGIPSTDATLTRLNNDLVISVNGTTDRVTVEKYFASTADNLYPIHSIRFSDVALDNAAINARAQTAPGVPPASSVVGTSGDDVLVGTSGDDVIYGLAGNDQLSGLAGNDYLDGGTGNDLMTGGLGDDMFVVDNALDLVREFAGEGTDTVLSFFRIYSLGRDVENLTLMGDTAIEGDGNELDNYLTGNALDNVLLGRTGTDQLYGQAGNDFLNGELGNDLMAGGTGNDTMVVDNALDIVKEFAGEGTDTVQSYVNYSLGSNVENLILIGDIATTGDGNLLDNYMVGNGRDNVLLGRSGDDVLYGHSGNDFLNGELGNDQMFGGVGNDTVIVDSVGDYVWEAAGEGSDTVQSYISYTLQDNFENLILIGQGGITATGNGLANVIHGNDRDNVIDGKGGLDVLVGNAGNDSFVIYTSQEKVEGGTGIDTVRLDASLTFLSFQGIAGTGFTGIEAISMQNGAGHANTVRLTLDQLLSLSSESNTLRVDGDSGDTLQLQNGWSQVASPEMGYNQYTNSFADQTGVLLVGQATTVVMSDWL